MDYSKYCREFRQKRKECLAKANYQCERCGVKHRSFAFNRNHEIYIVYLAACHLFKEQKMEKDAFLVCLCMRCHYFLDHPRNF